MATLSTGYVWQSGDTVTPALLNQTVNSATVSSIANADISNTANIAKTKIAGTALTLADTGTVTGSMVANNTLVNANISPSAAIALSKLGAGALPTAITVANANITGTISNDKLDTGIDAAKLTTGTLPADRIGSNAITTARINDAAVTAAKLDGAQTGSAPIYGCRAWVNFDGTSANNISGTYSRTAATVTVDTSVAHNLQVGHVVYLDFTSGTAADGTFTVATVPSTTQFTVTHGTTGATSGNVTLLRRAIRAAGNVAHVTYNNTAGDYSVNFTVAMPDANYAMALGGHGNTAASSQGYVTAAPSTAGGYTPTAISLRLRGVNGANGAANIEVVTASIFR